MFWLGLAIGIVANIVKIILPEVMKIVTGFMV